MTDAMLNHTFCAVTTFQNTGKCVGYTLVNVTQQKLLVFPENHAAFRKEPCKVKRGSGLPVMASSCDRPLRGTG